MTRSLLTLFVLALSCVPALAGGWEWRQATDSPRWYALWNSGKRWGWYDATSGEYRPVTVTGQYVPELRPEAPPIPPPPQSFGVVLGKLGNVEPFTRKGRVSSREEVSAAIGAALPDYSKSVRITAVGGTPEQRKAVLEAIKASKDVQAVQPAPVYDDFDSEAWQVKDKGFTNGTFTLLVQAPTGEVLHRQEDDKDAVKGVVAALRDRDPQYDSKRDPDRRAVFNIGKPPTGVVVGGVGLALLALIGGRKRAS